MREAGARPRAGHRVDLPTLSAVPKYSFNFDEGRDLDAEAYELADLAAARLVAVRTACAMIGQNAAEFVDRGEWRMSVCDEQGLILFSITAFSTDAPAAQTITIGPPPATV